MGTWLLTVSNLKPAGFFYFASMLNNLGLLVINTEHRSTKEPAKVTVTTPPEFQDGTTREDIEKRLETLKIALDVTVEEIETPDPLV